MVELSRLPIVPLWRDEMIASEEVAPLVKRRWRYCIPFVAAMLLFLGALGGVLSWINDAEKTHLIPGWMTEFHSQRWPSLAAAQRDHMRIVSEGFFHGRDLLNPAFGQRSALQRQLSLLSNLKRSESVVIYISGYAGIDDEGEVYCLPSNSNPDLETDRLLLREVLLDIKSCPSQKKLLVLDISWGSPDPRMGVVSSLIIPRSRSLLEEIKDPYRRVLTSAADGQAALVSEELGQSIFGYYFIQGLRGRADGWSPSGIREGRVSLHELVAFVQFHVARWARMNRETEQVPLFIGEGRDFELVALASAAGDSWPEPPAPTKYPDWLNKAWQVRDQWVAARYREMFPRIFQQWETALRRAEQQWRFAPSEKTIESDLNNFRKQLESRMKRQRQQIPMPQLHSLALLKASGVVPDPAAAAALKDLLTSLVAKTANQPPDKAASIREELIGKFQKDTEKTAVVPMAMVICDQLAENTAPTADDILLLDRLMHAKQPEPYFAETLLLRNLAELAAAPRNEPWHSATIHQAVLTGMAAEDVTVKALTFPWVSGLLSAAWQRDHDAKVLLWSRGYASWDDADAQLRAADQQLQMVEAYEDALTAAQYTLSDACQLLPEYFGRRLHEHQSPNAWFAAARICTELAEELTPPAVPLDADEATMRKNITDIRRQVLSLIDLYAPVQPDVISQSLAECAEASAGPAVYFQTRQMLALPTLKAEERKQIWESAHQLSLRLLTQTMDQDKIDSATYHRPQDVKDAVIPSQFETVVFDELLGYRESLELLRICGLVDKELAPTIAECQNKLETLVLPNTTPSTEEVISYAQMADRVREFWFVRLPAEIESCQDLAHQARLARLFPSYATDPTLDDPNRNPLLKIRVKLHRERWAWLAENYQYAARDVLGPRFYAEAARDYTAVAGPMPSPSFLNLMETGTPPAISLNSPRSVCDISWNWSGPAPVAENSKPLPERPSNAKNEKTSAVSAGLPLTNIPTYVACYSPSEFLRVATLDALPATAPLEVQLSLAPGVLPSDLASVRGFMLQVNVAGRNYHLPIKLPNLGDSQTLDLLVGTTPLIPAQSLDILQLRPIKGTHSYYLFARNLGAAPRDARVEILAGSDVIAQAEVKLAVGQTLPVVFTGTPPAPNTELPEITLPIVLRAVDSADGTLLVQRALPCDMLSPREYLAVTNVVFDPSSPSENSLNVGVQALSLEQGPPLAVRLSAPSDQIPGLVGIQGGAFVGSLPSVGSSLLLQAKNMQFTPSARQPGRFFVDVDDYPRAFVFRTMFPRQGDPIFPIEDSAPRLQLLAPRMGLAGPGYPVTLPTDNAPMGATLDLAVGRMNGRIFQPELTTTLQTARHERIGFAPHGTKGEMLAQASMRDWELQLDTTGIVGQRQLRARMLDVDGREMLVVQQTILLDDTPPEQVSFISPPTRAAVKQQIELRAIGVDSLSGIEQVVFFLGKPVDGKMPPGVPSAPADPLDESGTMWAAQFVLPAVTGRTDVSVQFTNGVGQSTFATVAMEILDPAALAVGNIQGTVVEGPRPQADLDVELLDAHGKPAKMVKTTADGSYAFEGVAAGDYTVSVTKTSSQRKGKSPVTVTPGSNIQANISLAL